MYVPYSWLSTIFRLTLYFIVFALLGAYLGRTELVVALAAFGLIIIIYWRLDRLNKWIWHSKSVTPVHAKGIWEHIYDGIHRSQRRTRKKRQDLGNLVKRFREGSEALPDAAVVVDAKGQLIWCNRLARIELGLRWPEDKGQRVYNFIRHPKFHEFYHKGHYDHPIELPSPVNHQRILEYRLMPYVDKQMMLLIRDVTQLAHMEKMRTDFVANVSHELRTPLTVINGYLEMLPEMQDLPPETSKKAISEMRVQSARMQNLVEELLALSRIEASNERVFEQSVEASKLLKSIELEANALNNEKEHELSFKLDQDLRVYGSESELRSAFSNIIFNAIHYTPSKGKIEVTWKMQNHQAHFSVKDNGEGIEARHLGRLTERFYRVDKARSRSTGGSGLGLAIVKHVLNHHKCELHIQSRVGLGSEFSFSFPSDVTIAPDHNT